MIRSALALAMLSVTLILVSACQGVAAPAPTSVPAKTEESKPAAAAPDRLNGTVQGIDGTKVTLADGTAFTIGADTRLTRSIPATLTDLQAGEFAAITAKMQPDGSLLASIVNIFPTLPSSGFLGQFPMDGGNLMTNAEILTVDPADGGGFNVQFPGGSQEVRLGPDVRMSKIVTANASDIVAGSSLSATVVDGMARSVSVR